MKKKQGIILLSLAIPLLIFVYVFGFIGWDNLKLSLSKFRGYTTIHNNPLLPQYDEDFKSAQAKTKVPSNKPAYRLNPSLILSGGPGKDGIPALENPPFDTPTTTPYQDNAQVLGVVIHGKAKAYPYGILNWHEIVNDTLGGVPISVTYCPLCDTGITYERTIDGRTTTFGVSGKLYNNCLVMYDRGSDTLWEQPWGTGVVGPLVNTNLVRIPTVKTTLGKWLQKYPDSQILSTNTGHHRDYFRSPYGDYATSSRIIFPLTAKLPADFHPKTAMQVAWLADGSTPMNAFGGDTASVTITELKDKKFINKELLGKKIAFVYDPLLETARTFIVPTDITNITGKNIHLASGDITSIDKLTEIPSTRIYGFVYYAHYIQ